MTILKVVWLQVLMVVVSQKLVRMNGYVVQFQLDITLLILITIGEGITTQRMGLILDMWNIALLEPAILELLGQLSQLTNLMMGQMAVPLGAVSNLFLFLMEQLSFDFVRIQAMPLRT